MSKKVFITGTGTDVGKTYVAGLLLKKLCEHNKKVAYFKIAMSGNDRDKDGNLIPGDAVCVKKMSGTNQEISDMCPYVYELALSPHLAARIEGKLIDMHYVFDSFDNICKRYDYVIVEGSGGIICPLRFDDEVINLEDFVKARKLNSIIVANANLGTINATVLTARYMLSQNMHVKGIIFNHWEQDNVMQQDNLAMCEYMTGLKVLSVVKEGDSNIDISLDVLDRIFE